jgi:hypothetical protein
MNPTDEQIAIVRSIRDLHTVVDAVAGSGKTSTIKFIAMTYVRENILVMMYNVERRKETTAAMKKYGFTNIEIQTFNSAGYNFYGSNCFNDNALDKVVTSNREPQQALYHNIIILDEVQDKTDLYYRFTMKLMHDSKTTKPIKLVLLGDYMQAINSFNGSKTDYILEPEKYYAGNWNHLPLSLTFRMTIPMVNLVNALTGRIIRSDKPSNKRPQYYICDDATVFAKIREYLTIYNPQDIFILTPTTRKSNNVAGICNLLTAHGIPIYVTGETYGKNESINGKLVISTIHIAKGSERKVVFVYGFDDSVLPKMLGEKDISACDPLLYVALTRASEELLIFHGKTRKFIVPRDIIASYCDVYSDVNINKIEESRGVKAKKSYVVTDMVKYLSFDKVKACKEFIEIITLNPAGENIADFHEIPKIVPSIVKGSSEDISDINGFIVPSYCAGFVYDFEALRTHFQEIYKHNSKYISLIAKSIKMVIDAQDKMDDIEAITRAATAYCGLCNNLFYKTEQIRSYNWMKPEFLRECSNVVGKIGDFIEYEIPAEKSIEGITIRGRIDAVDVLANIVYEFKCVDSLTDEHILQLALYAFLMTATSYRLLNIYTGEMLEVRFRDGCSVENIIRELITI